MTPANAIASAVLEEFKKLPENRKPAIRANGVREWVPLSGIVAEFEDGDYVCLAQATGMKCLPTSKLASSKGIGIHDWHAEVLALRAFNRFILQECQDVLLRGDTSSFLRHRQSQRKQTSDETSNVNDMRNGTKDGNDDSTDAPWDGQPFEWRPEIVLHMYCSEAPCGDASMELTIAAQNDASPWVAPIVTLERPLGTTELISEPFLLGRGYFSRLGTVRRKPGRGDAPPTLSKSCSDKLALRQCTTILSGLVSLLVAPSPGLCLRSVVLPVTQYSKKGCLRCFSADATEAEDTSTGRMAPVAGRTWPGGYVFTPLTVQTTDLEFAYSKRSVAAAAASVTSTPTPVASSNLSVAWTLNGINECLVNGVLRGRKAFDPTGASAVSRRQMWKLAREIAEQLQGGSGAEKLTHGAEQLWSLFQSKTYADIKSSTALNARGHVKEEVKMLALPGWLSNEGDEHWGLDT